MTMSLIKTDSIKGANVWRIKGLPFNSLNCFFSPNLFPDPAAGIIAEASILKSYIISIASP